MGTRSTKRMPKAKRMQVVRAPRRRARPEWVHQFLVVLTGTDPLIWRRIQVPLEYSFWDLHVAIQDAMGWHDSHLHEFRLLDPMEKHSVSIGIPTDEARAEQPVVPSWEVPLSGFFERRGWHALPVLYAYDFGDDWEHMLVHEEMVPADPPLSYPRCVAGARRCPPEDCGGPGGYARFLEAIASRRHPQYKEMLAWVGGAFDPNAFDPAAVRFDDPRRRWRHAFGGREERAARQRAPAPTRPNRHRP